MPAAASPRSSTPICVVPTGDLGGPVIHHPCTTPVAHQPRPPNSHSNTENAPSRVTETLQTPTELTLIQSRRPGWYLVEAATPKTPTPTARRRPAPDRHPQTPALVRYAGRRTGPVTHTRAVRPESTRPNLTPLSREHLPKSGAYFEKNWVRRPRMVHLCKGWGHLSALGLSMTPGLVRPERRTGSRPGVLTPIARLPCRDG